MRSTCLVDSLVYWWFCFLKRVLCFHKYIWLSWIVSKSNDLELELVPGWKLSSYGATGSGLLTRVSRSSSVAGLVWRTHSSQRWDNILLLCPHQYTLKQGTISTLHTHVNRSCILTFTHTHPNRHQSVTHTILSLLIPHFLQCRLQALYEQSTKPPLHRENDSRSCSLLVNTSIFIYSSYLLVNFLYDFRRWRILTSSWCWAWCWCRCRCWCDRTQNRT